MSATLSKMGSALFGLLYPPRANCLGCGDPLGADAGFLCASCLEGLVPARELHGEPCLRCGRPCGRDGTCNACRDWPRGVIDVCRFAYQYRHPADQLVRRMKYGGVHRMAPWMAEQIAQMMRYEAFPDVDMVVAVPMHKRHKRVRGFNQAEGIARELASILHAPYEDAIARVRGTRQQARLSRQRRWENLRNAFVASECVLGKQVLLVDDVLTTGATALGCAAALKAAGARKVYVVTLAAAT